MWATRWSSASPPPAARDSNQSGSRLPASMAFAICRGKTDTHRQHRAVSSSTSAWTARIGEPRSPQERSPNSRTEKQITFTAKTGQYVRLRALTEVNGPAMDDRRRTERACGRQPPSNQPPNSSITSPAGDTTIAPGQSVSFGGSGSDPDNNLPLTYAWNFGCRWAALLVEPESRVRDLPERWRLCGHVHGE